jgi:putative DNA methylase
MKVKTPKKLIEVALPLDVINVAAAREKSIRHGHPSTLHLWWARRPLAAARAVIFAQMVNDPGYERHLGRGVNKEKAAIERERLFKIIEDLVQWENTNNEEVLARAREEIWRSWRETCALNKGHPQAAELFNPDKLPAFHDPFAGGGALPLEAQRLGLEAHASDLNPVAVLICKAMIEIPPKFAGRPPVNPEDRKGSGSTGTGWKGAAGLAADVRYYGKWMRDEAEKRIGHLYPKVEITPEMVAKRSDLKPYLGRKLTVIAWLWARTVKSPNPAYADVEVPLASTFMLSTKPGKEAYVEPVIGEGGYRFTVNVGKPKDAEAAKAGTKLGRANFRCVMSGVPVDGDYIKAEGIAGRMGERLMAIVAEGDRGRVYLTPTDEHEGVARSAEPWWRPEGEIAKRMTGGNCTPYGLTTWGDLFTPRQLVALTTFSDLVGEAREMAKRDALAAGMSDDPRGIDDGGTGAAAYGDAVSVYLAFAISKLADRGSSICTWFTERDSTRNTFARQSIPMTWDYAELNTLLEGTGSFLGAATWTAESIDGVAADIGSRFGSSEQDDAMNQHRSENKAISTDPPYYDNVGYADLSDFFYVWLRRTLQRTYPALFATVAVPKAEELIATPYRHGSKRKAEDYFLDGMTRALTRIAELAHASLPVAIYYAFKQSETTKEGSASTGWETFLSAVIQSGFAITGTWPMRTELGNRMIGRGSNALASSIVLVCRPREVTAERVLRREFVSALARELREAIKTMRHDGIAPVDLAQAAIGPGMAVFTRYGAVLDVDDKPMTVRAALQIINQQLDEILAEDDGEYDADTRWAIKWFEQHRFADGPYGVAEQMFTTQGVSYDGLRRAGIIEGGGGKVRLFAPKQLKEDWDPDTDPRFTTWEATHHLARRLESGGEAAAAELLARLGSRAEAAQRLAYRLYNICERKGWAQEMLAYNALGSSWQDIGAQASEAATRVEQGRLMD